MRKRRVVGRIYEMKYSWKGHNDRNRHKKRITRSGAARLVYVIEINRNIPTTWRWDRGDENWATSTFTQCTEKQKQKCRWHSCFIAVSVGREGVANSGGQNRAVIYFNVYSTWRHAKLPPPSQPSPDVMKVLTSSSLQWNGESLTSK